MNANTCYRCHFYVNDRTQATIIIVKAWTIKIDGYDIHKKEHVEYGTIESTYFVKVIEESHGMNTPKAYGKFVIQRGYDIYKDSGEIDVWEFDEKCVISEGWVPCTNNDYYGDDLPFSPMPSAVRLNQFDMVFDLETINAIKESVVFNVYNMSMFNTLFMWED